MNHNTKNKVPAEKILLFFALLMCGLISIYNAFFIPEIPANIKLSGDISTQNSSQDTINPKTIEDKVNLNTADKETLIEFLPGVGPKIADRIIFYRETHGGFSNKEELMNIKGISTKIFEKIEKYIDL